MIGAGMLALPYAFKGQGIFLAFIVLILSAGTTALGLYFQTYTSGFLPKGEASFYNAARITYPFLAIPFELAIAIKCFGVCISYLVIAGNVLPVIAADLNVSSDSIFLNRTFWLTVVLFCVGPLSYLRALDGLKYTSIFALISSAYVVALIIAHYLLGDTVGQKGPVRVGQPEGVLPVLSSLPIIVFAFTCAHNMFTCLNELKRSEMSRINRIIAICIGATAAIYLAVGLFGYLSFGDSVSDNIVSQYTPSVSSFIGRVAIVLVVVFSFPLQFHPSRASIANIIRGGCFGRSNRPETLLLTQPNVAVSALRLAGQLGTAGSNMLTTIMLALSFGIAYSVQSLELVLSFVGSTGATAVSFIFPGIFAYYLAGTRKENWLITLKDDQRRLVQCCAFALIVWGVLITVSCLSISIYRVTTAKS